MKRVLFLLANLIALAVMTNAQPVIPADLILINGRIYTVDSVFSTCESFAIKDGRFLATGTSAEISEKYCSDRVVDAQGLPVYPGFIDGHCHFYGYALSLRQTDLKGARSFQEVLTRLQDYARNNPSGWIVGRGWDHNLWEKKIFPDRRELDIIFPDRPVVLIRIDGHVVLANGEAMKRAGIGDDKMFLPGEVEIREGRMTGILSENASDRMRNCIPPPDPDQLASLLRKAQQNCFGQGLTGVCDAGLEREEVTTIDSLQRIGSLSMKIYAMLSPSEENLSRFIEKGIHKTSRLNIRSVKLYADGSLGSRTALLKNPYSDDPGKTGIRVTSADSLRTICSYALKYGYQVNTHAIGDSAVKLTLGRKITEKWPLKLFSTYASTEMGTTFTECPEGRGGHHHPELIIAEFLDDNDRPVPEGEPGEVTVTTLGIEGMPLLRFRTGDVCAHFREPCPCGRTTMRLGPLIGRKNQMIKYKGTTLYPPALYDILDNMDFVSGYVVEVYTNEIGTDEIRIHIGTRVPAERSDKDIKDHFRARLRVAPDLVFEPEDRLNRMQFPETSRKPVRFIDNREKNRS